MRKGPFFALLILLVLSLAACGDDLKSNTVSDATLTEREKAILSNTAEQSFVFDFNVEDKYKEVAVWVEKYESGNLVGEVNHITTEIKDKGTIIFTTSKTNEDSNQATFAISVNSDGSTGTGWGPESTFKDDFGVVWGSNPLLDNISISDKMVLAAIYYSNSDEGMSTPSTDFYQDPDSHLNELKNYDVVYLLKSEFK